eukprot:TRINITY_DN16403_c0_g1_i9.p1 TRINITY_DN16403_c0_g1~~TRINITY_DN16403_c0_g1_i9.p1  ORF type:complete len:793 (+),score=174.06 TRINITY_DN16403_c0_g1_i9:157-2535(+)
MWFSSLLPDKATTRHQPEPLRKGNSGPVGASSSEESNASTRTPPTEFDQLAMSGAGPEVIPEAAAAIGIMRIDGDVGLRDPCQLSGSPLAPPPPPMSSPRDVDVSASLWRIGSGENGSVEDGGGDTTLLSPMAGTKAVLPQPPNVNVEFGVSEFVPDASRAGADAGGADCNAVTAAVAAGVLGKAAGPVATMASTVDLAGAAKVAQPATILVALPVVDAVAAPYDPHAGVTPKEDEKGPAIFRGFQPPPSYAWTTTVTVDDPAVQGTLRVAPMETTLEGGAVDPQEATSLVVPGAEGADALPPPLPRPMRLAQASSLDDDASSGAALKIALASAMDQLRRCQSTCVDLRQEKRGVPPEELERWCGSFSSSLEQVVGSLQRKLEAYQKKSRAKDEAIRRLYRKLKEAGRLSQAHGDPSFALDGVADEEGGRRNSASRPSSREPTRQTGGISPTRASSSSSSAALVAGGRPERRLSDKAAAAAAVLADNARASPALTAQQQQQQQQLQQNAQLRREVAQLRRRDVDLSGQLRIRDAQVEQLTATLQQLQVVTQRQIGLYKRQLQLKDTSLLELQLQSEAVSGAVGANGELDPVFASGLAGDVTPPMLKAEQREGRVAAMAASLAAEAAAVAAPNLWQGFAAPRGSSLRRSERRGGGGPSNQQAFRRGGGPGAGGGSRGIRGAATPRPGDRSGAGAAVAGAWTIPKKESVRERSLGPPPGSPSAGSAAHQASPRAKHRDVGGGVVVSVGAFGGPSGAAVATEATSRRRTSPTAATGPTRYRDGGPTSNATRQMRR